MNNQLEPPLTAEEYGLLQERLLRLLARQAERYTMQESTSVRIELAQELLGGICYCLGISAEGPAARWRYLLVCDLEAEYQSGLRRIEQKKRFGRQLWQTICTRLPPVENQSMLDTLKSIGGFWQSYDSGFFAHKIPCDLDYQLAAPVPESYQGIDYVNQYLGNLFCENRFLSEYAAGAIIPVLHQYCPDYKGLLVNLFEPVAANALGLAVLGKPDEPLRICPQELSGLGELLGPMQRTCIQRLLLQGLDRLGARHTTLAPETLAYLSRYCQQLAVRIDLLREHNGLGGIFMAAGPVYPLRQNPSTASGPPPLSGEAFETQHQKGSPERGAGTRSVTEGF